MSEPLDDPTYRAEVKKDTGLDLMPGERLWEREKPVKKPRSWRDGVRIIHAVPDDEEAHLVSGRWMYGMKVHISPEDTERVRQGYVCIGWPGTVCFEPHETPFPEKCSLCGFPMRARQVTEFGESFGGSERSGSSTTLREDFDRLEEDSTVRKFERQKARGEKPTILVPSWASVWDEQ